MIKYLSIIILTVLIGCQNSSDKLILVSKDTGKSYTSWMLSLDSNLKVREFYTIPADSMSYFLRNSSGIIMTGGEDVNPDLYGKPDYKSLCEEPDNFRDSIEKIMIRYAMKSKTPMLGICRGQQIINVVNGGTLIPDIPTDIPDNFIAHRSNSDSAHVITPVENSWINGKYAIKTYWVNSRHHQCVDQLANGFVISAYSPDGVIESMELGDRHPHPFVVCVQWHPESLRDSLATTLGELFLEKLK